MNIFFKDTVFETEKKEVLIKDNPHALNYFQLIENQNNSIIQHSAANYYEIHENFENLGKKIIKFEEKIKEFQKFSENNFKNQEIKEKIKITDANDVYTSLPQIDLEISELTIKIDENEKRIGEYKVPSDKIAKSIPEDEDFLNKIAQERKTIVDSLSEEFIIEMTYKDNFIYEYQYDFMEILLEQLNKLSFNKVVREKVESLYNTFAQMSPDLKKETIDKTKKSIIFDNFKVK